MTAERVSSPVLFDFWAKSEPFHPLLCHLMDAGNVALSLLDCGPFSRLVDQFARLTGLPPDAARNLLAYIVAVHDIGKCYPEFQGKVPKLSDVLVRAGLDCTITQPHFRHEAASGDWLRSTLRASGFRRDIARTMAQAIRAHHGHFRPADTPAEGFPQRQDDWDPWRQCLDSILRQVFDVTPRSIEMTNHSAAGVLIAGLVVLSDWIASNEDLFPRQWNGQGYEAYQPISRDLADRAVDRLGLHQSSPWRDVPTFREAWPALPSPRPIQQACEDLARTGPAPGLTIIEAPMGEGKSEAAMYLGAAWMAQHRVSGIYLALPTAATSNQMYQRFQGFLTGQGLNAAEVQLVHGASWLIDSPMPERAPEVNADGDQADVEALQWFRPQKRSLLARFGVGTIDQALLAALNVKHGFLRLFGLSGKVLIVDEAHAYDAYMFAILRRLLTWCRALDIPVILLSGTLPESRRRELVTTYQPNARVPVQSGLTSALTAYPLITCVETEGTDVREIPVPNPHHTSLVRIELSEGLLGDPAGIAQQVVNCAIGRGGCLAVIVNTVSMAQTVYEQVLAELSRTAPALNIPCHLFHARFLADDRRRIEDDVMELFGPPHPSATDPVKTHPRPPVAILVATQVAEQSLDLDFDEMFTEIAPIDLLLQRAGRLHRHARGPRPTGPVPVLHIMTPRRSEPNWGNTDRVYAPYILWRTWLVLRAHPVWHLPQQTRNLVEQVYRPDSGEAWPGIEDDRRDWEAEQDLSADEARRYVIPSPQADSFSLADSLPYHEDEDAYGHLSVSTRRGHHTVRIALVEGNALNAELLGPRLSRDVLRVLLGHSVGVPAWWVTHLEAAPGFSPKTPVPHWLSGGHLLRTAQNVWRGRDQDGNFYEISTDPTYGVRRTRIERITPDA